MQSLLSWLLLLMLIFLPTHPPARADTPVRHLLLGNPSGATTDVSQPNNYLVVRPQYALAYLRDDGIPRWVAWQLVASDLGSTPRYTGNFFTDTSLPIGWYRVRHSDYTNSGYDRGHMVSSEDRTATIEDNEATFILTNALPQAPRANRGPWLRLEEDGRDLASAGDEVYIVAGPVGQLGRLASTQVRIPAATWKVLLAVPAGAGDPTMRVMTATRVIAIRIANDKDDATVLQSDDWQPYATTADAVEAETGLDVFAALNPTIQRVIEARPNVGALGYTLIVSGTSALTTTVGTSFAPLTVRVARDTGLGDGPPVPGVELTLALLGSSANASIGGDVVATAVSDANGVATFAPLANLVPGSYRAEISANGVYVPAVWALTNVDVVYVPVVTR